MVPLKIIGTATLASGNHTTTAARLVDLATGSLIQPQAGSYTLCATIDLMQQVYSGQPRGLAYLVAQNNVFVALLNDANWTFALDTPAPVGDITHPVELFIAGNSVFQADV